MMNVEFATTSDAQSGSTSTETFRILQQGPKPHTQMLERLRQTLEEFDSTLQEEDVESARVAQEFENRLATMQSQIEGLRLQLDQSAAELQKKQEEIENHMQTIKIYADLAATAQQVTAKATSRIDWYKSQMKRLLDLPPSAGAI